MLFALPALDIEDVLIFALYLLHVLHLDLAATRVVYQGCMDLLSQVSRPIPRIATADGRFGSLIFRFPLLNTEGAVAHADFVEPTWVMRDSASLGIWLLDGYNYQGEVWTAFLRLASLMRMPCI